MSAAKRRMRAVSREIGNPGRSSSWRSLSSVSSVMGLTLPSARGMHRQRRTEKAQRPLHDSHDIIPSWHLIET